jgi:alcohol dehydrogenase (cytochrome c)
MKPAKKIFAIGVMLVLPSAFCGLVSAQGLDPATLLKPTPDSWPIYHGDYSGQRHSHLSQITPANVHELTLAWAFQTGQAAQIKSSPVVANGILYVSVPDHVWAVDAQTGSQVWHYTYPTNEGSHIGHRGVALYKASVYFTTPDNHLVCLNAKDGAVRWNVVLADLKLG